MAPAQHRRLLRVMPFHWRMLGLALSAQIAVSVVMQGVPTLAPFLQEDLGLTRAEVGLFNSAIVVGSLLAMFVAGWVVDIKGERSALVGGNIMVGICCVAMLGTTTFHAALFILFLAGLGGAFPTPAGSKAVMGWFSREHRGLAMGVRQTGIPLGGALAAATLPAIALAAGWRMAVVAGGLMCFLTAAACAIGYRNPPAAPAAPVAVHHRLPRFADYWTPSVLLLGVSSALLTLGQFTLVTYLALYLKETQGTAIAVSASLLFAAQLSGAAGRIGWGMASDRLFDKRRKPALLWANGLAALGALALGWLPAGTPIAVIAPLVLVYAFCTLGWHGTWIALVAEIAGPERQGRTIGIAMSLMYPGIIVLPPLIGLFVDRTHSWSIAWSACAAILVLGVLLLLPVREQKTADG